MPVIYLIDFENVGNKWADVLENAGKGDTAVLFYSENSPKAMLDQLEKAERKGISLKFRRCAAGHNGLDFQLSSELGYLIASSNARAFVIVSGDAGYDVLPGYWAASGVSISRYGSAPRAGSNNGPPRQALYDALNGAMAADDCSKLERMHILGCARACLEQETDPGKRFSRFCADTKRYKSRRLLEKLEGHVLPALDKIFRDGGTYL